MIIVSKLILAGTNLYGWLLPDGSFHQVPEAHHAQWAAKYLKESFNGDLEDYSLPYSHNWLRIIDNGSSTNTWTDDKLHRLQVFLMKKGVTGSSRTYFLDGELNSCIVTTFEDLLVANKLGDLRKRFPANEISSLYNALV